jgi:hypothetical protein
VNFFALGAGHEFRREFKEYFEKKRGLKGEARYSLEFNQENKS